MMGRGADFGGCRRTYSPVSIFSFLPQMIRVRACLAFFLALAIGRAESTGSRRREEADQLTALRARSPKSRVQSRDWLQPLV